MDILKMTGAEYGEALRARLRLLGFVIVAKAGVDGAWRAFARGDLGAVGEHADRALGALSDLLVVSDERGLSRLSDCAVLASDAIAVLPALMKIVADGGAPDCEDAWDAAGACKDKVNVCHLVAYRWLDVKCVRCHRLLIRGGSPLRYEVLTLCGGVRAFRCYEGVQGRDKHGGARCGGCAADGRIVGVKPFYWAAA